MGAKLLDFSLKENSASELGFNVNELLSDVECTTFLLSPPPPFFQPHHLNQSPPPPPHQSQVADWKNGSFSCSTHQEETLNYPPKLENFLDQTDSINHQLESEVAISHAHESLSLSMTTLPAPKPNTFGQRTSIYRGVTRHRWTGRYEAHLWDNSCTREGQSRKGRQVYLGGYDKEEKAARAYDLAALKYWGTNTTTNFPISDYDKELEEMKLMTRQEHVASLRRKSSGFSRGASIYRGVTRHHQHGKWQARIGRVAGNKDLYLGTFSTQEQAAEAYDVAAIKFRGLNAVTNFEINRYDVKSIMESSTLPIGGSAAKRLKDAENKKMALQIQLADDHTSGDNMHGGRTNVFQAQPLSIYPFAHQTMWSKQVQDSDAGEGFNDHRQLQLGRSSQDFLHNDHMISVNSHTSPVEQSSGLSSSVVQPMMGDDEKALGRMYGSTDDDYQASNLYYQSSWDGIAKTSFYNWVISSGVPARDNTMAVCHGASLDDTLN